MKRLRIFIAYVVAGILIVAIAVLLEGRVQPPSSKHSLPASQGTPVSISPTIQPTVSSTPIHATIIVDRITTALSAICSTRQAHSSGFPLIADATVGQLLPSHWNTPGGMHPTTISNRLPNLFLIVTPLHFLQMSILLDRRTAPTSELVTLGGVVGQDQISVDGYPQLLPHQRYLLFFDYADDPQTNSPTSTLLYVTLAYPITAQNMVIDEEQSMPLAEIVTHIKTNCP